MVAACEAPPEETLPKSVAYERPALPPLANDEQFVTVGRDISIGDYFEYLDTLVNYWDARTAYPLDEHLLVWANSWIIDTLAATDYYDLMARGIFQYDLDAPVVLRRGDRLRIPDSLFAQQLLAARSQTFLDLNIPEFKLRIYEGDCLLHTFLVRVGQNRSRYLAMAGREVDICTRTGSG